MSASQGPLGEVLQAWRARIDPVAAELATYGDRRRVAGLRREELALLAGVSASYYTRLEQGQSRNASPQVLDAIADALRLNEVERAHLHTLAVTQDRKVKPKRPPTEHVDPALAGLLAALGDTPAMVLGRRCDVLAWNRTGHALLAPDTDRDAVGVPARRPNFAELVFLDPLQRELYADWPTKATSVAGSLRLVAGRYPDDPVLALLIGRLSMASLEFAQRWADHRVQPCTASKFQMDHPLVGRLTVLQQSLQSLSSPEQLLVTCTAPAGSPSAEALALLAQLAG